jgi:hemoglobin-like flavoprotein
MMFYDRLFNPIRACAACFMARKKIRPATLARADDRGERADPAEKILGAVEELGRRHLMWCSGGALCHRRRRPLWTLQTGLGDAFTSEVREAWTCAYMFLSSTMQRRPPMLRPYLSVGFLPHRAPA